MVRLARCGVPPEVVAGEFAAAPQYVEGLVASFEKEGAAGLVGEEEVRRFEALHPPALRVATYNLHGVHDGDDARYRLIAQELAAFEPDLVAFQEVIDGSGDRETSAHLAAMMSAMAGADYRTAYPHCHLYMRSTPRAWPSRAAPAVGQGEHRPHVGHSSAGAARRCRARRRLPGRGARPAGAFAPARWDTPPTPRCARAGQQLVAESSGSTPRRRCHVTPPGT
jgi:hypothetical protein